MSRDLTARQRLIQILTGSRHTSRELAHALGLPERQVEDHLVHIVRSLRHEPDLRFVLEPASCHDCGFVFRDRRRLTCPSRCPRCRSEGIHYPRFGIDARSSSRRTTSHI